MVVLCLFVIEIVGSTKVGFDYNRKKQEGWIPSFCGDNISPSINEFT
jgi:hypothetical protein